MSWLVEKRFQLGVNCVRCARAAGKHITLADAINTATRTRAHAGIPKRMVPRALARVSLCPRICIIPQTQLCQSSQRRRARFPLRLLYTGVAAKEKTREAELPGRGRRDGPKKNLQRAMRGVGSTVTAVEGASTVLPLFACVARVCATGSARRAGIARFSPSRVNV